MKSCKTNISSLACTISKRVSCAFEKVHVLQKQFHVVGVSVPISCHSSGRFADRGSALSKYDITFLLHFPPLHICCLFLLTVYAPLIEEEYPPLVQLIPMAGKEKSPPLDRASVQSALELIKPHIHRTPVLTSTTLSDLASTPQTPEALIGTAFEGQAPARPKIRLFFKCENYQRIGAFKSRGAFHALARLTDEELSKGVVTHSSGTPTISDPSSSPPTPINGN